MEDQENRSIFGVKYIHINNAANILGLKKKTLERIILVGEITATKIGRSWFLTESNIKDYLEEKTKIGVVKT